MLKKLTLGMLVLAISSSSFALEIYKGTILSHKESTTGGIKGILKQQPMHTTSLRALEDEDNQGNVVNVNSEVYQQSAILGETTKIQSSQSVFIMNRTTVAQEYNIYTEICVGAGNFDKNTGQCYYIKDNIALEAGGYYAEHSMPELLMAFNDLSPKNLSTSVEISRLNPLSDNVILFDDLGNANAETNVIVTAQQ